MTESIARQENKTSGREDVVKLLAVFLDLPQSLEKSAHMLVLKYLREHGWQCTVFTVDQFRTGRCLDEQWHGIRVLRIAPRSLGWRAVQSFHKLRQRLPRRANEVIDQLRRPVNALVSFPDHLVRARRELVRQAMRLHKQERFCTVLALYYPFTSYLVASDIARQDRLPWVALTKDYYSWPDAVVRSPLQRGLNRLKRCYEQRVLSRADAVAAVNDNIAQYLRTVLGEKWIQTLAHCYDEQDFPEETGTGPICAPDAEEKGSGTFCAQHPPGHSGKRCLTPFPIFRLVSVGKADRSEEEGLKWFFDAVGELLKSGEIDAERFRLRFVGYGGDIVNVCARRASCAAVVEIVPQVPHAEAIREMRTATCLLFQQAEWGNRRRLAEYFAARRPIVAFPDYPGVMSQTLLHLYGAARLAGDKDTLKSAIVAWYREFLARGRISVSVNDDFVQGFSARRRASELDGILRKVVDSAVLRAKS